MLKHCLSSMFKFSTQSGKYFKDSKLLSKFISYETQIFNLLLTINSKACTNWQASSPDTKSTWPISKHILKILSLISKNNILSSCQSRKLMTKNSSHLLMTLNKLVYILFNQDPSVSHGSLVNPQMLIS